MQRYLIPNRTIYILPLDEKSCAWGMLVLRHYLRSSDVSLYAHFSLYVAHIIQKTSFSIIRLNLFYYSIEKLRASQREYWKQSKGEEKKILILRAPLRWWKCWLDIEHHLEYRYICALIFFFFFIAMIFTKS